MFHKCQHDISCWSSTYKMYSYEYNEINITVLEHFTMYNGVILKKQKVMLV